MEHVWLLNRFASRYTPVPDRVFDIAGPLPDFSEGVQRAGVKATQNTDLQILSTFNQIKPGTLIEYSKKEPGDLVIVTAHKIEGNHGKSYLTVNYYAEDQSIELGELRETGNYAWSRIKEIDAAKRPLALKTLREALEKLSAQSTTEEPMIYNLTVQDARNAIEETIKAVERLKL